MSESITFTSGSATIYGSLAGARAYLGPEFDPWDVAADAGITTDMRRALVKARRYIDSYSYAAGYTTFAERDALDLGIGSGDAAFPFRAASYRLAEVLRTNPEAVTPSTGRKVASISAGGDSVSYQGAERTYVMHPSVLALLAPYLADEDTAHDATASQAGCSSNPFSLSETCE